MSFNKAFIRFSVFLSCPCHDRYSSNACSVNVMLVPIGKLLQLVHRLDYHLALPGLLDAVVQCPHIAVAVKGVCVNLKGDFALPQGLAHKDVKGRCHAHAHVGKDGLCTLFQVFVNADDKLLMNLTENYADSRYTYGTQGAFLKGEIKQTVPYLVYDLLTPKGHLYIKTHLVGGYNFDNAMATSAIGTFFNIDPLQIQQAIENYHPSNLRSQLIKTPNNTLILDAYNANPSSMAAAIHNFKEMPGEHKIVILGEMLELGQASDDAHRNLLDNVLQGHFEKIFLIGNHFEHCKEKTNFTTWFPDTLSLIAELKEHPLEGKFILVKGSRGNRLEQIVEYL